MKTSSIKLTIIGVLVLVIVAGVIVMTHKPAPKLPAAVQIDTKNQPTLGDPKAKLHFVAFEDLKCGNCKRYNLNTYPKLKAKYIKTGKAKYTVINLAFIPGSMPAANAARCVYEQKPSLFFDYVAYIYKHQPPENTNWATIPRLLDMASHVQGIDQNKLSACLVASPYTNVMAQNFQLAGKIMKGSIATPSLYLNGVKVDPPTMEQIERVAAHVN